MAEQAADNREDPKASGGRGIFRFSLRAFTFSLVVISLAIAYRQRPFEVVVDVPAAGIYHFGGRGDRGILEVGLPPRREKRTMQYLDFVNRSQHGVTEILSRSDVHLGLEHWIHNERTRREFQFLGIDGSPRVDATWERELPEGEWIWHFANPLNHTPQKWRLPDTVIHEATLVAASQDTITLAWNGAPGTIEVMPSRGQERQIAEAVARLKEGKRQIAGTPAYRLMFRDGKLTHINDKSTGDFFYLWNRFDEIPAEEAAHLKHIFNRIVVCETNKRRQVLPGVLRFLDALVTDRKLSSRRLQPVSFSGTEVPLCVTLYLLLKDEDVAFDYRHGTIHLTTQANARAWSDFTGVRALDYKRLGPLASQQTVHSHTVFGANSITLGDAFTSYNEWLQKTGRRGSLAGRISLEPAIESRIQLWGDHRTMTAGSLRNILSEFLHDHQLTCVQEGSVIRVTAAPADANSPPAAGN